MNAFTKVVANGGYAEAARRLGLTRSGVSKAVMELEHILGARLLDRTTRRVTPTEAGLAYYERCIAILAQVEETENQISRPHDEPKGVLKINGPMSFGTLYLGSAVADFMALYQDIKIELTLTDRVIDPLEEGVDVTVRIATLSDSSLIARRVAPARRILAASLAYIARHGAPETPAELSRHRCLTYGYTTSMRRWRLEDGGATVTVPINACLCSNNGDVLRTAALQGNGITDLPTFIVGQTSHQDASRSCFQSILRQRLAFMRFMRPIVSWLPRLAYLLIFWPSVSATRRFGTDSLSRVEDCIGLHRLTGSSYKS